VCREPLPGVPPKDFSLKLIPDFEEKKLNITKISTFAIKQDFLDIIAQMKLFIKNFESSLY